MVTYRCARSRSLVDLTFELGTVTLSLGKVVRIITLQILGVASLNLIWTFMVAYRCVRSRSLVDLTFDLGTMSLTWENLSGHYSANIGRSFFKFNMDLHIDP